MSNFIGWLMILLGTIALFDTAIKEGSGFIFILGCVGAIIVLHELYQAMFHGRKYPHQKNRH